ncbi:hypothetical protein CLV30_103310 [Haloactinopolyspora alba]|uniref:ABC transporter permease n=1 Tax=Haloactinopolyspora alba TaxID=648780 RepID=A0A2P8E9M2_9ACTN|nr:hypothetical protein [Haloactinopolyspora alba]PSL06155.1 hypothetical protein CLV30_103310 [Haloactinopolyspora alba]
MKRVIALSFGLAVLIGVLMTAFVWPNSQIEPRDVPLAVAGPPEAAEQVEGRLAEAAPGAFEVEAVADEAAARAAIEDRDVYGAIVMDPAGTPTMLTASAASPAVARLLDGVAAQLAAAEQPDTGPAPAVEDVVTLPDDDARGVGFNGGAFPMVIAGTAAGAALVLTVSGVGRRLVGAASASVLGGLSAVLVMQAWLGVLGGDWWANAGVFALTIGAVSTTIIGLHSLIGVPGVGLGALIMVVLGNPLSGVTSAPEMLPSGWGALGQALPPGAGGTLLRSTSYFDGAAAGGPLLVLTAWIAGGLLLAALGAAVSRRSVSDVPTSPAAPADPSRDPAASR